MFAIGLLTIGAIPTTIGVAEAISAQKKQNAAQKEQAKFHLTAKLSLGGRPPMEAWVVLKDGRLWIDHQESPVEGHKFTGYYFTYPSEEQHKGLVSTISIDPPMLNWIYVDKESSAVRYGGRKDTLGHVIGPWGWNDDETFLTLRGSMDCFVAEEDPESRNWFVALHQPQQQQQQQQQQRSRQNQRSAGASSDDRNHRDRGQASGDVAEDEGPSSDEDSEDWGGSDDEDDDQYEQEDGQDDAAEKMGRGAEGWPRRARIQLRRRMVLGMESRYVKNDQK